MPTFKDTKSLFAYLEKQKNSVLRNEVANLATEEMSNAVEEFVYNEYEPYTDVQEPYIRRGDDGGLSDVRNYTVSFEADNSISIKNNTMGNSRYPRSEQGAIDHLVVSGKHYNWKSSKIYTMKPFPRDFYEGTAIRLRRGNLLLNTFKAAMKTRGFDVK